MIVPEILKIVLLVLPVEFADHIGKLLGVLSHLLL